MSHHVQLTIHFSFKKPLFTLYSLDWIISVDLSSHFLTLHSVVSNLLSTPSGEFSLQIV
jgi:hypothetical protein